METYEKIVEQSEKILNCSKQSHSFYISQDIALQETFFCSKRMDTIVFFETEILKIQTIERLVSAFSDKKTILVCDASGEHFSTLKKLNQFQTPFVLLLEKEKLTESKRYDFQDLVEIMSILRGDGGCEWDKAQTHESIRINLIEEAYELVEGIDKKDSEMILEETGDVLLQAVFHTQIEMEDKKFDYNDMLSNLCSKLVTRHTHIFGENKANNAEEALTFWQDAKKVEKGYSSFANAMQLVPNNFPSLLYAYKVQKIAKKSGFDWNVVADAVKKIEEETNEVLQANDDEKTMEGGDLLFAVVNVLRMLKIEPELALKEASKKFVNRFAKVESELTKNGQEMTDFSLEEMDEVWNKVKIEENKTI